MKKWPKIGERISERLRALGYWRGDGRPDVMRFSLERRYVYIYLYRWLGGATPDHENIYRLAADLQVSPSWLLFGEEGALIPTSPPTKPLAVSPARRSGRGRRPLPGANGARLPEPVERVPAEVGTQPVVWPVRKRRRPQGVKEHYVNWALPRAA